MAITLRPYQEKAKAAVLRDWTDEYKRVALSMGVGTGKCIAHGESIFLADGSVVPVESLVGSTVEVIGVTDTDTMKQVPVAATFSDNGDRDIYEIHLDNGTVLRRTGEHPLWAARMKLRATVSVNPRKRLAAPVYSGWVSAKDLEETGLKKSGQRGHVVLVPRAIDVCGKNEASNSDVFLCAMLLAEGNLTRRSTIRFSSASDTIINRTRSSVMHHGCKVKQYESHKGTFDYHIVPVEKWQRNGVRILMDDWSMMGKSAYEKSIPEWVFRLPDYQIASFLRTMIDCDGWYYHDNTSHLPCVAIALANEAMVRQISALAMRLGITGRIRYKSNGHAGAWEWLSRDVIKWGELVGSDEKCDALNECVSAMQDHEESRKTVWSAWRTANHDSPHGDIAGCPEGYEWRKIVKVVKCDTPEPTVSITVHSDNHAYVGLAVEHNTENFLGVLSDERARCLESGETFRALILAHQKELVEQPKERAALNWRGKLPPFGLVQGSNNQFDRQVIVATFQTLAARRIGLPMPVYNSDGTIEMVQATTDHEMPFTDADGAQVTVSCTANAGEPVTAADFAVTYFHGLPVTNGDMQVATLANYNPLYEGRQVVAEEVDFGLFGYRYADDNEPVLVPETKKHPLRKFKRLRKIIENGGMFTHLVIDECHHMGAPDFFRLLRCLKMLNPNLRILGVSATLLRPDGVSLSHVFEKVSYRVSTWEAIYIHKCNVPFTPYAIGLPTEDASHILDKSRGEDYTKGELSAIGEIMSAENALALIVSKWQELAGDRPTMVYAGSVMQAQILCDAFVVAGVDAATANGKTPKSERREIVKRFRDGKLQMLVCCDLWKEGLDIPQISCVLLARLVKHVSQLQQMLGRGLRRFPGKNDCILIECFPQGARDLKLPNDLLGTLADKQAAIKKAVDEEKEGEQVNLELISELERLEQLVLGDEIEKSFKFSADDVIVQAMDYFQASALEWTVEGDVATATVARDHAVSIIMPQQSRIDAAREIIERGDWDEKWNPHLDAIKSYQVISINGGVNRISQFGDWEAASKVASVYADENKDRRLAHSSSDWRSQPPSSGQIYKAKQIGIVQPERMTRGALSAALTHKMAVAALLKSGIIKS